MRDWRRGNRPECLHRRQAEGRVWDHRGYVLCSEPGAVRIDLVATIGTRLYCLDTTDVAHGANQHRDTSPMALLARPST